MKSIQRDTPPLSQLPTRRLATVSYSRIHIWQRVESLPGLMRCEYECVLVDGTRSDELPAIAASEVKVAVSQDETTTRT
jgi:hypothetical protein